jgi:hypothetical protein
MFTWLKGAFSDNGAPSSSRLLTFFHSFCAIGVISNFSFHNHGGIPDVATLGGLAAFATVHYAVNRTTQGFAPPKQ